MTPCTAPCLRGQTGTCCIVPLVDLQELLGNEVGGPDGLERFEPRTLDTGHSHRAVPRPCCTEAVLGMAPGHLKRVLGHARAAMPAGVSWSTLCTTSFAKVHDLPREGCSCVATSIAAASMGTGVEIWRCMSSLAPCMFVVNLCPCLVRCVVYTVVNHWKVKTKSLSLYIYLSPTLFHSHCNRSSEALHSDSGTLRAARPSQGSQASSGVP